MASVAAATTSEGAGAGETKRIPRPGQPIDLEELVGNSGQQRNWRGIVIALLVILIVCGLIVTAILLVMPESPDEDNRVKFDFNDFLDPDFKPHGFYPQWLKGEDSFVYRNDEGSVLEYNCTSNNTEMIMDNTTFNELNTGIWHLSPDRMYVLLPHDIRPIYRHSKDAVYSVYNVKDRTRKIFEGPHGPVIRYIAWSPIGHSLIIVQNNNIYYLEDYDFNVKKTATQITTDGVDEEIFNGIPDWVYEEEVLASDNAIWWSTKGSNILFAQFNDTEVRKFVYPFYGDMTNVYGEQKRIAYPKPGTKNPTFKLKVVKLKNNNNTPTIHDINPPNHEDFNKSDHYFTTVEWRDDNYFLVTWVNRAQNFSIIMICTVDGACEVNQREEGHGIWVDLYTPPLFTPSGDKYFWILPNQDSNAGYFKHVAMVTFPVSTNGKLSGDEGTRMYLTHGRWVVTQIVGYSAERELVYYIATNTGANVGDPRKRHLFSVSSSLTNNFRQSKCLTCGTDCQYARVSFSDSGNYYMLDCKGPNIPYSVLKSTISDLELVFENNDVLRQKLTKKAMPREVHWEIPTKDGDEKLYGKLLLPPMLKEKEITTYPLLLNVYGGPGSQKVSDQFSIGWDTYLASSHKIIIGYVDGRGSGYRGNNFLKHMYKRFGTVEVEDTLTAGDFYNDLPYVESSKKAIWGWQAIHVLLMGKLWVPIVVPSYGGFLTAMAIGQGTHTFGCGISVAPVTDFRYYDTIYTERYMGKPEENQHGYRVTNVSLNAKNFKDSRFMLIHGTGDDNVHFQNSAQLMKALVEADVYFRSQVYTDKTHSLTGGNTRKHLYESMEDFLKECFTGQSEKFELRSKKLGETKQEPINES